MARPAIRLNGVALPLQMIAAEAQHHPARTPAVAFENAARALIVRALLLEEALRRGITAAPAEVRDGKWELPAEAQIRQLLETCVPIPQVSDAQCRDYYAAQPDRFRAPELIEASHILFAADPRDSEGVAKAEAAALFALAELQGRPDLFEAIARERSDCGSKASGGRLGQLAPGETAAEFEDALTSLTSGTISQPVKSRFGFHLIRLDARLPGERLPYEYVHEKIAAFLGERAWRHDVTLFIEQLIAGAWIEGVTMQAAKAAA
ncbi:MAG: peptidylprolyl isomerase [Alphaproteobacteria bacterium]|nr:peptidylprolyl isomerase [Alphaproteobacteria bacterium]